MLFFFSAFTALAAPADVRGLDVVVRRAQVGRCVTGGVEAGGVEQGVFPPEPTAAAVEVVERQCVHALGHQDRLFVGGDREEVLLRHAFGSGWVDEAVGRIGEDVEFRVATASSWSIEDRGWSRVRFNGFAMRAAVIFDVFVSMAGRDGMWRSPVCRGIQNRFFDCQRTDCSSVAAGLRGWNIGMRHC